MTVRHNPVDRPNSHTSRMQLLGSVWRRFSHPIAIGIAILLLGLLAYQVPVAESMAAMAGADVSLASAATLLSLLCATLQTAELRRQALRAFRIEIPFRSALLATAGTLALHHSLPAGSGAAASIAYLRQRHGASMPRSIAAFAMIFWLKLVTLLVISLLGWCALPQHTIDWTVVAAAAVVLPALTVLLWISVSRPIRRWAGRTEVVGRMRELWLTVRRTPLQGRALALTVGHSLLSVLSDMLVFGLLLRALGARIDTAQLLAYLPLCLLGARIPISSMGLGTREALVLLFFSHVADAGVLFATSLLFSVIEHMLPALLGTLMTAPFLSSLAGSPRPE